MYSYPELLKKDIYLTENGKFKDDIQSFFSDLNFKEYDKKTADGVIVICSFDVDEWKERLETEGLVYEKDFIYGTDLIKLVDETETFHIAQEAKGKKVIVMGVGERCQSLIQNNPNLRIDYFIDADAKNSLFHTHEKPYPIDKLKKETRGEFVLIVTASNIPASKTALENLGLEFGDDFWFYNFEEVTAILEHKKPALSELLTNTIKAPAKYKLKCSYNSKVLDLNNSGWLRACCAMISLPLGNLCYNSVSGLLRSVHTKIIVLSIRNNTYVFCAPRCNFMSSKDSLAQDGEKVPRKEETLLPISKFTLALSYDHSCNLECKSCRKQKILTPPGNPDTLDLIHSEVIRELPNIESFIIGYGEVFFSKYYREVVFEKNPSDSIKFFTNGMLFNEETWEKIKHKYKNVSLTISMDGITKETFEYLRGGNFEVFTKNIELAGRLRANNEIQYFETNFVVQKDNFRQMVGMVVLGKKLNVDLICFNKINNFTYTTEEFLELDVYNPKHKLHDELVAIVSNPLFKQKGVYVKNIENLVK